MRKLRDIGFITGLAFAATVVSACRRDKTADIAQDSILVRDADTAHPSSTTSDTIATRVRDRGSVSTVPSLTNGAPVKRSAPVTQMQPAPPTYDPNLPVPQMPPPRRVNPPVVLPPRAPAPPPPPPPSAAPQPVVVPVSPSPSPPPAPKPQTDSGKDTLRVYGAIPVRV